MSNLVDDFWTHCQCYEIPKNYAYFGAIGLLGAAIHRKVYVRQGNIFHHGMNYITLVGEQGNKKSTVVTSVAWPLFKTAYPNMPVGSSVTSREGMVLEMASPDGMRTFKDQNGSDIDYCPMMLFVNELENFMSFNDKGMLTFLCDVYESPFFKSSTIKRGLEDLLNPTVNMLACVPPDYLSSKLRGHVITGGIFRRMLLVYEQDARQEDGTFTSIPIVILSPEALDAQQRILSHLVGLKSYTREYLWETKAEATFRKWYDDNKQTLRRLGDSSLFKSYIRSKDVHVIKMTMLLDVADSNPTGMLVASNLDRALEMLSSVERNIQKLSVASGRNELALPIQRLIDSLEDNDGWLPEKKFNELMQKDFEPYEVFSVKRNLINETGQLVELETIFEVPVNLRFEGGPITVTKRMICTARKAAEVKKRNEQNKL